VCQPYHPYHPYHTRATGKAQNRDILSSSEESGHDKAKPVTPSHSRLTLAPATTRRGSSRAAGSRKWHLQNRPSTARGRA
jgi:hypothetical protein